MMMMIMMMMMIKWDWQLGLGPRYSIYAVCRRHIVAHQGLHIQPNMRVSRVLITH